ncbi:hypothetical protein A1OQ_06675 [Enterovibrio norvegicus FF-162]|uniref:hypothetical protein n=1 Tax=Enterovibrio norvegicus TaxID=188144 RepID=UPI000377B9E9|nr:hypothetical protein [Enterovibrio norvegicus]OEE76197.1 hypothetical protein A1OQ_06675 [Enterovibrio norvegicus FF-162]
MFIECDDLQSWLEPLKTYQKNSILALENGRNLQEIAEAWLSARGPESTVPFGGTGVNDFSYQFIAEFKKFVCGDPKYQDYRDSLSLESPVAKGLFISTISAGIGATLGFAAALLAPAVACMLCLVGKLGTEAWCQIE